MRNSTEDILPTTSSETSETPVYAIVLLVVIPLMVLGFAYLRRGRLAYAWHKFRKRWHKTKQRTLIFHDTSTEWQTCNDPGDKTR